MEGMDFTRRFPAIAAAVLGLPSKSCIIDGELIAAGWHGKPDFLALPHGRHVPTCVYCFDLLELNGRDPREQPLVRRRARFKRYWRTTSSTKLSSPLGSSKRASCPANKCEPSARDPCVREGRHSGSIVSVP